MPTWSVMITQGSLTQEADLQIMRKLHSPSCAIHRRSGGVALWPLGSETSEDAEDGRGRFSKIRARQYPRNEQVVTSMAADRRASRVREREVGRQKGGRINRWYPVTTSPDVAALSPGGAGSRGYKSLQELAVDVSDSVNASKD